MGVKGQNITLSSCIPRPFFSSMRISIVTLLTGTRVHFSKCSGLWIDGCTVFLWIKGSVGIICYMETFPAKQILSKTVLCPDSHALRPRAPGVLDLYSLWSITLFFRCAEQNQEEICPENSWILCRLYLHILMVFYTSIKHSFTAWIKYTCIFDAHVREGSKTTHFSPENYSFLPLFMNTKVTFPNSSWQKRNHPILKRIYYSNTRHVSRMESRCPLHFSYGHFYFLLRSERSSIHSK